MSNPIYMSKDEIIAIVNKIVEDCIPETDHRWHAEDAYYQIEYAMKSAFVALIQLTDMRNVRV